MERGLHGEMQDTNAGKWRGSQQAERVRVGSRLHLSAFLEAQRMNGTLLFRTVVLASLASAALFVAQSASASKISVTDPAGFSSPVTVTTWDTGSITIDGFEVTNTTDPANETSKNNQSVNIDADDIFVSWGDHDNNPNDKVTGVTVSGGSCDVASSTPLNVTVGNFCTIDLTIDYVAGPPYKGHPNPFGSNQIVLTVDATNAYNGNAADDTLKFRTRVDYVTPEPGSLLLFGTGMLGLAGLVRRKLSRR